MLKNVDPILSADVLHALCSMGHADELVLVDANYPADTSARSSTYGRLLRIDGADVTRAARAILSVFPLDSFVDAPAERMQVDGEPDTLPPVQQEVQKEIDAAEGRSVPMAGVKRSDFYQRAKKAYVVIATGEMRGWGCFIFKKGVNLPPGTPGAK
jgi:L-fucose mutarotase